MSTKKGRGAKVLQVPPYERRKGPPLDDMDSPNLSAVGIASFLEGLQLKHGNPLHSTALDEDLNVSEEGQVNKGKAERKDNPPTLKNNVKQHGAAMKGKEKGEEKEEEVKKKRSRKSTGDTVKTRPEGDEETKINNRAPPAERGELDVERKESEPSAVLQGGNQPNPTVSRSKHLGGRKPTKRRGVGQTSAARPVKSQQRRKGKKEESESGNGRLSDPLSQEESDTGTTQHRRKYALSDEEGVDEDMSWNPSPKKAKVYSLGKIRKSSSNRSKSRKSSSGSASAGAKKANPDEQRTRRQGGRGRTELEVVLDAFLDFCEQYRATVESEAVKQSIDGFSSNVKQQLLEKINSSKEFRCLKRENAKVGSLIRKKTQRLLDAKYELMRAERQAWLLQKEKDELQLRLADLKRGQAFLHDIRELNRQYLDYRHKHPREKETYGATSLPALLLETKHIQSAEHQLRGINNRLERIV